jgi:hypothetical protein
VVGGIKSIVDTSKETKQVISGVDNLPQALKNDNSLNELDSDSRRESDSMFEYLVESQAFDDLVDLSRYVEHLLLVSQNRHC